jgi:hypothetical protein
LNCSLRIAPSISCSWLAESPTAAALVDTHPSDGLTSWAAPEPWRPQQIATRQIARIVPCIAEVRTPVTNHLRLHRRIRSQFVMCVYRGAPYRAPTTSQEDAQPVRAVNHRRLIRIPLRIFTVAIDTSADLHNNRSNTQSQRAEKTYGRRRRTSGRGPHGRRKRG